MPAAKKSRSAKSSKPVIKNSKTRIGKIAQSDLNTVLGINTSIGTTQVVLIQNKKTLFAKSWTANFDEMEKIMPVVEAALKKVKRQVNEVIVVNGPGPFTSLRIGVALANTLAYALKAKVFALSTWEYFHQIVPAKFQKNTATVLRAGGEFVAIKLPSKKTSTRLHIDEVEKFLQKNKSVKYMVGDAPPAQKHALKLGKNAHWLDAKSLRSYDEIIQTIDTKKLRHPTKNIAQPQYLLPPKITQSKKPVFV